MEIFPFKIGKSKLEKLKAECVAKPQNVKVDLIFKINRFYPIQPFPILNWKRLNWITFVFPKYQINLKIPGFGITFSF